MTNNTFITRFQVGRTYRLHTSQDFPKLLGGLMTVRSVIKPTDRWGNRIILADFRLVYPDGQTENRMAARCFVEEGNASVVDSYGERVVDTEIAQLQGIYPNYAKAYAIDGVAAANVA